MFDQNVNKSFTTEDILFEYSDLIDDIMLDGYFDSREEVANLIRMILLKVDGNRYDLIKFFVLKTIETRQENDTMIDREIKGFVGADYDDVFEKVFEKYSPKMSKEKMLMRNYDEEYSYSNNIDFYNDLDCKKIKTLKKAIR